MRFGFAAGPHSYVREDLSKSNDAGSGHVKMSGPAKFPNSL